MVSNFRRSSKVWTKTLDMHMHFCGFSQHYFYYFIFFLSTWGVNTIINYGHFAVTACTHSNMSLKSSPLPTPLLGCSCLKPTYLLYQSHLCIPVPICLLATFGMLNCSLPHTLPLCLATLQHIPRIHSAFDGYSASLEDQPTSPKGFVWCP